MVMFLVADRARSRRRGRRSSALPPPARSSSSRASRRARARRSRSSEPPGEEELAGRARHLTRPLRRGEAALPLRGVFGLQPGDHLEDPIVSTAPTIGSPRDRGRAHARDREAPRRRLRVPDGRLAASGVAVERGVRGARGRAAGRRADHGGAHLVRGRRGRPRSWRSANTCRAASRCTSSRGRSGTPSNTRSKRSTAGHASRSSAAARRRASRG